MGLGSYSKHENKGRTKDLDLKGQGSRERERRREIGKEERRQRLTDVKRLHNPGF